MEVLICYYYSMNEGVIIMAKCRECRKKVRSSWKSCPVCGTPLKGGFPLVTTVVTITLVLWAMNTFLNLPG